MHLPPWLIATMLLVLPRVGLAQAVAPPGWELGLVLESARFSRGLVDGAAPSELAAGLRPSTGTALALTLARSGTAWRGEVVVGWAGMRPQADNEHVAVLDRTSHLTRVRLGAALERSLFGIGAGSLALGAGPTLDWWRVVGEDRVRGGGSALVALRLPLGTWVLENRLGLGVSGSPFVPEDVGESYETRTLLSITFGVAARAPL